LGKLGFTDLKNGDEDDAVVEAPAEEQKQPPVKKPMGLGLGLNLASVQRENSGEETREQ